MNTEFVNLWMLRLKSFGFNILGVLTTSLVSYFLSNDFHNWVLENWGSGTLVVLVMALITEGLKHWRNVRALGKADTQFGSISKAEARKAVQLI